MKEGLGDLFKQAQQMQEQMQKAQEDAVKAEVTGEAGAGLVQVIMNGRHDAKRVVIDPALLTEDKEMLEDLIAAAINDAARKIEANSKDTLSSLAGGLNLPEGFKMPF